MSEHRILALLYRSRLSSMLPVKAPVPVVEVAKPISSTIKDTFMLIVLTSVVTAELQTLN